MLTSRTGTVVLLLAALVLGYLGRGWLAPVPAAQPATPGAQPLETESKTFWTCSMHPEVRQPGPGKCPKCAMDLIPVIEETGGASAAARQFTTSETAKALMNIQTSPVERRFAGATVRMVGKVDYDETRLGYIAAWVSGRLDRLYVDYTGMTVRKGDHMVYLYSPELITAQEELRRAVHAIQTLKPSSPDVLKQTAQSTLDAVRRKLRLWGLTQEQIDQAERSGALPDHITIYAPIGGTVIHKDGQQGMYVETGTRIYTIADLSHVWVKLDAYESDLPWIRYGQKITFTTEAHPGETFEGRTAFIDPIVDQKTRTVKVRVNVPNPKGTLKPGMFVRGVAWTQVARGGRVMDLDLAGKWISPMHPEVVKDGPGACDVCGMPLVRAEALGYVPATADESAMPLVIPASAPLITGTRAVVYVEVPGAERPTYEGREVALGPRASEYYLVKEGLREGERVVTNGNFKIDSALQILAKPSMMSPAESAPAEEKHDHEVTMTGEMAFAAPPEFQAQLRVLFDRYATVQKALANDDAEGTAKAVQAARDALAAVNMGLLGGDAHVAWMTDLERLESSIEEMGKAKDIEALRSGFGVVSEALADTIRRFGDGDGGPVYQIQCPMAFEWGGATWLQTDTAVRNPYFGAAMLDCGTVVGVIAGDANGAVGEPSQTAGPGHTEGSHSKEGTVP